MATDIGDEQEAQDDEQQHILASPNINTNTTSDDVLEEIGIDEPKVEIDHAPIKEEDIKFRSENIVRTKGEDLMTNVEGAEERREREKRAQEKREKEAREQIKKIKEKETKEQTRAARRSRHKAARQAAHTKVKRVAEQIYHFRFPIIALAIIAVGIAVADVVIIPAINAQKAAEQQAAKEKAVADNETVMLKILSAAIDKELDETELEDLVKTIDPGATISYFREKGIIYDYDSGSGEAINFIIDYKDGSKIARDFGYTNTIGDDHITISGTGGAYYYSYGEDMIGSDDIDELISNYVLRIIKWEDE